VRTGDGLRILVAAGPGARPEPLSDTVYDAVLLDLAGDPALLGLLRHQGAVTTSTQVHAVHADHRLPSPDELSRRMGFWRAPRSGPHRTLLLGGSRSGKSAEAELRLLGHPHVTYVATGGVRDGDAEWTARVAAHRERRPGWWQTIETADVAGVLRTRSEALLIDGMGTWLAAAMDACGAWDDPASMRTAVRAGIDDLLDAWRQAAACVVAVTDEVGLSLIPETASGRLFRDLLGELNQRLAAESEETALIVAGRIMELPS
jgi:adenosylcobinamide kinase/adenosylcobinamide-phosphate guanylyltransferase